MSPLRAAPILAALVLCSCVAGSKIRADAEVITNDIGRAERSGAVKCAPRELAYAVANRDFAMGELDRGNNFRAQDHIHIAEENIKKALELSRGCAPKQILVRERDQEKPPKPPPQVVKIEIVDTDGDGLPDKDDKCPDKPEDKDGFQDDDGCPDPDNDNDGVLDANDRCPNEPGPFLPNQGCPVAVPKDKDGDGVTDDVDKCPDQPEDKDGFQDDDGCPDLDNDNDGVLDAKDKCPNEAGPLETLGCPVHDKDGDGIPDDKDKCPDQPEDKDGFQDDDGCIDVDNDEDGIPDALDKCPNDFGPLSNKGCPVKDRDGDGVPDDKDKCPDQPEDKDGFQDDDGCPDPDNDSDGIPDKQDKCPDKTGPAENDGCPDVDTDGDGIPDRLDKCPKDFGVKEENGCAKQYKLVVVKRDRIEIKKQIKFKTGSGTIIGKESFDVIAEVAQALKDNPQIKKLRVEGHTDSVGNDAANLKLSQKRADSVMSALLKQGIDPGRLEAVGFGETRPIASNGTASGRAENRRTEFNVVEQ
jgi:outer membrane protein OmpA-like peptidoglycan-associated protein